MADCPRPDYSGLFFERDFLYDGQESYLGKAAKPIFLTCYKL